MYNMVPRGLALKMCIGNGKNLYKDTDEYEFQKKIEIINYSLNQEQKKTLKFLENNSKKFCVSVLQGTTGSEKNVCLFRANKKIIDSGKQASFYCRKYF